MAKKDTQVNLRLDNETFQKIKELSTEGNVSQWIRILIQKELEKEKTTN